MNRNYLSKFLVLSLAASLFTYLLPQAFAAAPTGTLTGSVLLLACGATGTSYGTLTVTDTNGQVNLTNDIRIKIQDTANATWDPTVTTVTRGGAASSKVSATVSYTGGNKVLIIDVTSNFTSGDVLTIGGLKVVGGLCSIGSTGPKPVQWAVDGSIYGNADATTNITIYKGLGTTTDVNNVAPAFTVDPADGSDGTTPTNSGSVVHFTAMAHDNNGDSWYLAVCKTPYVKAMTGAQPQCCSDASKTTCDTNFPTSHSYTWAESASHASDAAVTSGQADYTTLTGDVESNDWHAFACDGNTTPLCSGDSNTASPFKVNHRPVMGTVTAGNAYGSNASVDPSSGGAGGGSDFKIFTDVNNSHSATPSSGTIVQSDGKILVAGTTGSNFVLVRYNSDGTLDTGFGTSGVATLSSSYTMRGIALQSDGKIVAVGGDGSDFVVARFGINGTLDSGFGSSGIVTTDTGASGNDAASAVAIQSDGKIVVVGLSNYNGSSDYGFEIVRYSGSNGALDGTFGTGGKVRTTLNQGAFAKAVAIQSDGTIVVAGYTATDVSHSIYAMARYTTSGGLIGSVVTTDIAGQNMDIANAVVIQSDGKIVVGGWSENGSHAGVAGIVRYSSTGSLDGTFGTSGIKTLDMGTDNWIFQFSSLAIQSDGMILGSAYVSTGYNYASSLVRLTTAGALDTSFGSGGKAIKSFSDQVSGGFGIALQSNGKILQAVAMNSGDPDYNSGFGLYRFTTAGAVDTTIEGSAGATVYVQAGVTDTDTDTTADTVSMYVCKTDDFTGGTCASSQELCSVSGVASGANAQCSFTGQVPIPTTSGSKTIYVFLKDSHGFWDADAATPGADTNQHSYNVTDIAPVIGTFSANDIAPTAGGSVVTSFTVLITDDNGWGDVATVNGAIYDSNALGAIGTGTTLCTPNEKNCYLRSSCTLTQSTTTVALANCDAITTWFNINPSSPGVWKAHINALSNSPTVGGDSNTFVVDTLSAVSVSESSIAYGATAAGGVSTPAQPTTLQNVGNVTIDIGIHGADMVSGSYSIPLARQHWATALGFTWGTSDHALVSAETVDGAHGADSGCSNRSVQVRPVHGTPSTDSPIYWKLAVPALQPTGSYSGSDTFVSVVDGLCVGSD